MHRSFFRLSVSLVGVSPRSRSTTSCAVGRVRDPFCLPFTKGFAQGTVWSFVPLRVDGPVLRVQSGLEDQQHSYSTFGAAHSGGA